MKEIRFYSLLFLIIIFSVAAKKIFISNVFDWEKIPVKIKYPVEVRSFFKSPTRSLDMFDIKAVTLFPGRDAKGYHIEKGIDELIIIKEGIAEIRVNDDHRVLGEGSIVVASSGDEVNITNTHSTNAVYYSIRFKPYRTNSQKQPATNISPIFVDWNKVEFKTTANGGNLHCKLYSLQSSAFQLFNLIEVVH